VCVCHLQKNLEAVTTIVLVFPRAHAFYQLFVSIYWYVYFRCGAQILTSSRTRKRQGSRTKVGILEQRTILLLPFSFYYRTEQGTYNRVPSAQTELNKF